MRAHSSANRQIGRQPRKVGIVGCGAVMERYYVPTLALLERQQMLQVSAMLDPDVDRMAQIGANFPAAMRANSYDAFLEQPIDLVIIASPPACHAEQSIRALRSGKSVLCEKPLATTLADGQRMVQAATDAQRLLAAGFVRRYFPATRAIKAVFERRMLGKLQTFHCFEGGAFQWPVRSSTYFDRKKSAGGVLLDLGPHVFDLLGWWLGPPMEIRYGDDAMGGVEANCIIALDYEGFKGEIRLSRDWNRPNRYVFQGSQGWLSWTVNEADLVEIGFPDIGYAAAARLHETAVEDETRTVGVPAANFHQSFIEQVRNIVTVINGEAASIVSGADALESVRLVEYCYRHRALMPMPWLSEAEAQSARLLANE